MTYLIIIIFVSPFIAGYFIGTWKIAQQFLDSKNIVLKYFSIQILLISLISFSGYWYLENEKKILKSKQFTSMQKIIGFEIPQNYQIRKYSYLDDNWQDFSIEFEIKLHQSSYNKVEKIIKTHQYSKEIQGKWSESDCDFIFIRTKNLNGENVSAILNKQTHILTFEFIKI